MRRCQASDGGVEARLTAREPRRGRTLSSSARSPGRPRFTGPTLSGGVQIRAANAGHRDSRFGIRQASGVSELSVR